MDTTKSNQTDVVGSMRPLSRGQGRRETPTNSQPGTGSRVALLFPGQGSQTKDMRDVVSEHRPDLLERAIEEMGLDPFAHITEGTRFQQPAIYCASIAGWERAGRPEADFFAGHSLGELAALVTAGSIDATDGLLLAIRRGELMQEAAERNPGGGMMAVIGDDETARAIAAEVGVTVANFNSPGQLVLSGAEEELGAAERKASEAGLRAIRLPVNGAFHSAAMEPVVPAFREALAKVAVHEPAAPVICGTTAKPFDDVRARLADALTRPVRWTETVIALDSLGVESFVESGPGKVLKNLVRRILPGADASTLDRPSPTHA